MNADPPGPGLTALVSFIRLSVSRTIFVMVFSLFTKCFRSKSPPTTPHTDREIAVNLL